MTLRSLTMTLRQLSVAAALFVLPSLPAHADSVLFIGNSFTYAANSPVRFFRHESVTDLNGGGVGGVPALVKAFSEEAGTQRHREPGNGGRTGAGLAPEEQGRCLPAALGCGSPPELQHARPGPSRRSRRSYPGNSGPRRAADPEQPQRSDPPAGDLDPRRPDLPA